MTKITRRDFLKLASLGAAGLAANLSGHPRHAFANNRPNIIIVLFDSMSATNMSLYGYGRETTPEISRFAERSTVYHAHYSGSNYTTTGTATMLTGMFPWKHRALTMGGLVRRDLVSYNPYTLLGKDYFRLMFSQNAWPDRLVAQYYDDVDDFLPQTSYSRRGNTLPKTYLGNERSLASIAFDDFLLPPDTETPGSVLLNYLYQSRIAYAMETQRIQPGYPTNIPEVEGAFSYLNEEVFRGITSEILNLRHKQPFFAYFHLFSPHSPYRPSLEFRRLFRQDGFDVAPKPAIPAFASSYRKTNDDLLRRRALYDSQIAQIDAEFGALVEQLAANGVLDNSYVIVTSDHGELFERGFNGHGGLMMYEPVLHIPLLIHAPKQEVRQDFYAPTFNTDLLPTILSVAGVEIPATLDGQVLPGFGEHSDPNRALIALCAAENSPFLPITKSAFAMRKGAHKLIAYLGYPQNPEVFELYNLEVDPEERHERSAEEPDVLARMKEEFLDSLADANRPFVPQP